MKHILFSVVTLATFLSVKSYGYNGAWQSIPTSNITTQGEQKIKPQAYSGFYLNSLLLKEQLFSISEEVRYAQELSLPQPDGTMKTFKIWQTPMMEEALSEKYPEIKTFTGYALDNKSATIKLDYTYKGFHAKVFDGKQTYFIDPYSDVNDGFYICYYKKDYLRPEGKEMGCEVIRNEEPLGKEQVDMTDAGLGKVALRTNGTTKKTYRLALACTIEYSKAVDGASPTKAGVLSAMVTSMNRVNGVYERELAVTMVLIANNDQLIYLSGTDPYSNSNGSSMLSQNQTNVDAVIGNSNYDIGHVFSTGGGGIASLGCVCNIWDKAQGVTGSPSPLGDPFDIDYVAHEMGHQFGSDHTFNANTGSCSGNGESSLAYEPGSGSTIMAYAGICGGGDNTQNNSDDYFHAASLGKIMDYITLGDGAACPVQTTLSNAVPIVPAFTASYSIPYLTPFELTAPAVSDNDHDALTYCWEQWNRGNFRSSWSAANLQGPIFKSFDPSISDTRVFVALPKLLTNVNSYVGEKLPQDTRFLTFKLTVRELLTGLGTFNFPDDSIHLDVINTGTPFAVTSPNAFGIIWNGGATETITWDVGSTDIAPINTPLVDILLSVDGGQTYPYAVATNIANDGSEAVVIPNVLTTSTARIKIKGVGNVFFDISNFNLVVNNNPTLPVATNVPSVSWENSVTIFPVPAKNNLTIKNSEHQDLETTIFNTLGQKQWSGNVATEEVVNVANWPKGVYYIRFVDSRRNERTVKKFVVE